VIAGEAIWSTAFYWASGDTIVWLQLLQGHWGKGYVSHDGSSIPVAWRMLVVEPIGASPIPFSLFSTFCASAWLDRFASFRVYALSGPRLGVLAVLSAAAAGVAGFAAFRLRAAWRELRAEGRSRGPSADPDAIRAVLAERERLGDAFPRFGILVVAYRASRRLPETLRRIPPALLDAIAEIFVFDELSDDETIARAERLLGEAPWKSKLRFYRNPQRHGYGGNQKVGFDYAIDRGLSHVILLHGDGEFAPERLAEMMLPVLRARASVVLGSRMKDPIAALGMGMPLYKWLSNRLLSGWQRFFLGMELSEFHCGYRLYATEVLQRLPYRANSDGYLFDTQMIIQCRALAVPITEVAVPAGSGGEIGLANGIRYAFQALGATIEYRLHQLHLVRHGRYLVDRDVRYQLKRSPFSSHGQILSRIRPGSAVLDVGCGPGLLAHQMTARGAKVVGVDILARDKVWPGLEEYHRVDLEKSGELLPTRQFDYVVLADVVEHVRNPQELLRGISKFLKPDGRLLLSSGNIAIWFYRLSLLAGRFHYGPRGILDETHVHLYTRSTLRHLLLTSGYRISAIRYTGLPFEVVFESTGGSALVRLVDRIYYALVRLWPKLFAYQFVIEARVEALEAARGEGRLLQSHDRDRRVA
jgi:SAM-dependent methyltransferase